MPTYTVHEPSQPDADRVDRASELRFVKDGFSWPTAVFPPLGLAMSQLWLPLAAYVVFVGAAAAALKAVGVNEAWISLLVAAVNVYLGFELSSLQRWNLDNNGWQMVGTVTGKNLAECERRFFESWLPAQPMISSSGNAPRNAPPGSLWRSSWASLTHKA